MTESQRRVVITGAGIVSPLGNCPQALWEHLDSGQSGVRRLSAIPDQGLPVGIGGEATEFDGSIENFGPLEGKLKRSIKKALRLMCREIEMGVASAQLALVDSAIDLEAIPPERIGTLFGSDHIMTRPAEFSDGIRQCLDEEHGFHLEQWGESGLPRVEPLWLLKYLPNMPASHVAIHNDLRGPSNSITMREASGNASIAEAVTTIRRGIADAILAGSTGTRIHPIRTLHVAMQEQLASDYDEPADASRPFDLHRSGMVLGEGAGCLMLEELESARRRDAAILGEVVGYSSTVVGGSGNDQFRQAFENVLQGVLDNAGRPASQVGHIHAHGLATITCDRDEATAIRNVFGDPGPPVVAAKSYMGNVGAGSGVIETVASLQALAHDRLFPILNYREPDPECPITAADPQQHPVGDSFVNVNITPQGQASAILVRRMPD